MHVDGGDCTRGATLERPRYFLKHRQLSPSPSLAILSALSSFSLVAAVFGSSENSKSSSALHQHLQEQFDNGDRHEEQGQGGGASNGAGQWQGRGVGPKGDARPSVTHGGRRARGSPSGKRLKYGHYHEEGGPTHFFKVIIAPQLEAIPMPLNFMKPFLSVSQEFKLKTNTGYSWRVTVGMLNDRVTLDQGWATFSAVHRIKIDYMTTFKLLP
ncbi:Cohesin subunit SA-1 [Hordeum vulgare]|nr:Cohesin subunit SA-1 [Hordeum vulgare]